MDSYSIYFGGLVCPQVHPCYNICQNFLLFLRFSNISLCVHAILAIVNNAAINIGPQVSLGDSAFNSCVYIQKWNSGR